MKKLFLILVSGTLVTLTATAQTTKFKPFKVDMSVGYAIPGGSGAKGGILGAIEPKYSVIDQISVGLRLEGAVVARGYAGLDADDMEIDTKASGSYLATGDYYYTSKRSFRPFSGVGTGIFTIAAASVSHNGQTASVGASTKFGGMVRSGFEAGHFRLAFEYNIVPSTKLVTQNGSEITSKNGYIGIKLGVCIGGGSR